MVISGLASVSHETQFPTPSASRAEINPASDKRPNKTGHFHIFQNILSITISVTDEQELISN